jgi:NAD(P) transhydrogenase subunit alpha
MRELLLWIELPEREWAEDITAARGAPRSGPLTPCPLREEIYAPAQGAERHHVSHPVPGHLQFFMRPLPQRAGDAAARRSEVTHMNLLPLITGAAPAGHAAGDFSGLLYAFLLATFVGLGVVTRVSRLLHTPLMSITNAISAIAVVGSISIAGSEHPLIITILGAVALFASMTNIVSGFLITDRMLQMFKKPGGERK